MSEPNIVEVSSSDDEETISTIDTGSSDCSSTLDSQCSICLGKIKNPSHPDTCLHAFCLRCLRRWADVSLLILIILYYIKNIFNRI